LLKHVAKATKEGRINLQSECAAKKLCRNSVCSELVLDSIWVTLTNLTKLVET
jgi:hypothetical protein